MELDACRSAAWASRSNSRIRWESCASAVHCTQPRLWIQPAMTLVVPMSLKQRVLNAGMWSLAGFALTLVLRLGSNLLMTRILAPEMFGVIAIASAVIVGLS